MKQLSTSPFNVIFYILPFAICISCSTQKAFTKAANEAILNNPSFAPAHVGISVYDPSTKKFLYNHQGSKYFVPASNTKLFTCYAAMKYLGDSILAARYLIASDNSTVLLEATGDPTFLHPDFKNQPLLNFLQQPAITEIGIHTGFQSEPLGRGWAWDDYPSDYMAERDPFPMYGNLARFVFNGDSLRIIPPALTRATIGTPQTGRRWDVSRELGGHLYTIENDKGTTAMQKTLTISMEKGAFAASFLADTLHKEVNQIADALPIETTKPIYSQPTDSLLKITMHRSDNFFAEQLLLMVSQAKLGVMNDRKIVDTLLKTDLAGLPQPVKWMDGSGLSRYNLFSPNDFVWLLNKMKDEFGFERLQVILPGANEGTLSGLYKGYEGRIFAKTGTLSNNVAISGYLITKKNKPLIFSVLVGNHQSSASEIRKSIEKFLTGVIDNN
ncbi:MAG: hypothetical protein JWQ96_1395 [Segetibacter sp.]|nr:hypothetical protein [Segetibacter sp.]